MPSPTRARPSSARPPGRRRAVWFTPSGEAAAVDPAAARGRAVRAQLRVAGQRPPPLVPAVDLAQHRLGVGLVVRAGGRVVPREVEHRAGRAGRREPASLSRIRRPRWYMNHSSERQSPGARTALWCHCSRRWVFVNVPSFSVWAAAGRKNTSVRDVLGAQLARLDLGRVVPERRALDLLEVAHDEPVELRHREPVQAASSPSRPPGSRPAGRTPSPRRRACAIIVG